MADADAMAVASPSWRSAQGSFSFGKDGDCVPFSDDLIVPERARAESDTRGVESEIDPAIAKLGHWAWRDVIHTVRLWNRGADWDGNNAAGGNLEVWRACERRTHIVPVNRAIVGGKASKLESLRARRCGGNADRDRRIGDNGRDEGIGCDAKSHDQHAHCEARSVAHRDRSRIAVCARGWERDREAVGRDERGAKYVVNRNAGPVFQQNDDRFGSSRVGQ